MGHIGGLVLSLSLRAVVAQLDRVPDYESGGRRFESSRPHHFRTIFSSPSTLE
jgi:hypothetical protein